MKKQDYLAFNSKVSTLTCYGDWDISNLAEIKNIFLKIDWPKMEKFTVDGKAINKMDSAGAFFLIKWTKTLAHKKSNIHFENFSESYKNLLQYAQQQKQHEELPKVEELGKS